MRIVDVGNRWSYLRSGRFNPREAAQGNDPQILPDSGQHIAPTRKQFQIFWQLASNFIDWATSVRMFLEALCIK